VGSGRVGSDLLAREIVEVIIVVHLNERRLYCYVHPSVDPS